MSNKMNLIFEPADLEQASPATVSRCGMIYLEPNMLGWQPFMASYVTKLEKSLLPEQLEIFIDFIEWIVPPALKCIRKECKQFVETSEIHMFHVII